MISAFLPYRAVRAVTTCTTEVPHHLPHRGLDFWPVADLARNHTDDPFAGADRRSWERWSV